LTWVRGRSGRKKEREIMSFVVAGVSGNTGKVVAESLLARSAP